MMDFLDVNAVTAEIPYRRACMLIETPGVEIFA
jgi:hypothetical protein